MIDFSKLSAKDLTALYNGLSSSTIKRFESHAVGIDRVTRLVSQIGVDEATVLEAMRSVGIEWPPIFDVDPGRDTDDSPLGTEVERSDVTAEASAPVPCDAEALVVVIPSAGEKTATDINTLKGAGNSDADEVVIAALAVEAASAPVLSDADRRILSLLRVLGPSKVGVLRDRWKAEDSAFGRLAPTQQKGIMRRSVRKLETAGLLLKSGPVFSLPS